MREGRASQTALFVAYWRAAANAGFTRIPGFADPFARRLLTGWFWRWSLRWLDRRTPDQGARLIEAVDGVVLRVAWLDAALASAEAPQVVILGAGLDTRAWRLPCLDGVRVFEVDHPATQAYKRARAPDLGAPRAELTFVPVDFTRDDLSGALAAAGHRTDRPTAWVWEGVTMYLGDEALRSTLAAVRGRCAPGSALFVHYHEPEPGAGARWGRRLLFRWVGEPQIGQRPREVIRAELERAGFRVTEDVGIDGYAARVGGVPSRHPRAQVSRIATARV